VGRTRVAFVLLGAAVAALALVVSAAAGKGGKGKHDLPSTLALPIGFQPEGIDIAGSTFYVGSIPTGAIYRGSLVTGTGAVFITPPAGRSATGIEADRRGRLFVAGGNKGHAYVYDLASGAALADYTLAAGASFINDVAITKDAVWFTDSLNPVLYKLPLGPHGALPAAAQPVPLTGDLQYTSGFNANGLDTARGGRTLVTVTTNNGQLFTIDPATGATRQIDLGGALVKNGDGILLKGRRLYVVQNADNLISVVKLKGHLRSGTIERQLTAPPGQFDFPTTIDRFRHSLYAVNARFSTPPTPTTPYWVTRVRAK
jgi:sugar lactone lactonase YvrE